MDVFVDVIDPADGDHVVFETAGEVELGQFDGVAVDVIDAADVAAVGADDFEVFLDERGVYHGVSPVLMAWTFNAVAGSGFTAELEQWARSSI